MGRIALEVVNKDDKELAKDTERCIRKFFDEHLCIRRNKDIGKVPLSEMNRPMLK